MYKVVFHRLAKDGLKKISTKEKIRIYSKIRRLTENPFSPNTNATKLKDLPNGYRLRIGKVRVVYEIAQGAKTLIVWKISPRGSVYSN